MTQIINGNKLIAEFCGHKFEVLKDGTVPHRYYRIEGVGYKDTMLRYHTSWDWLKPVIDEIFKYALAHPEQVKVIRDMSIVVTIEAAWERVVQFIQWYNQNKKP
jgi:hypothetical protein